MDLLSQLGHLFGGQQSGVPAQPLAGQLHPQMQPMAQQAPRQPQPQVGYSFGSVPVGNAIPQNVMSGLNPQVQQLAQIYNQNPQDPRVAHVDPAIFGYAPDGPTGANIPLSSRGLGVHYQNGKPIVNDNIGTYHDGHINSIGGKIGPFGGTIGNDGERRFANANINGQPIDPLSALRNLLGF